MATLIYEEVINNYEQGNICYWNSENGLLVEDMNLFVNDSSEHILDSLNRNEYKLMAIGEDSTKYKWINDLSCAKVIRVLKYKLYTLSKLLLDEQELNDKLNIQLKDTTEELENSYKYIKLLEAMVEELNEPMED